MTKSDALRHFGSQSALARALNISQPSVFEWGEEIPDIRQIQLERITNGELKADASCYLPKPSNDSAIVKRA